MATEHTNRIEWIDILKGIGIIIMIMGHVGFGGIFDRWIHSFHMPLFFIISGFLYRPKNKTAMQNILRKCRTLLLPYISFLVINYIAWIILIHNDTMIRPLITAFTYNTKGMPIAGALWFLTALFFTEVIYSVLESIIPNQHIFTAVVFILAIGTSIVSTFFAFRLPLALYQGLVGMGLFQIGRILSSYIKDKGNRLFEEKPLKLCIYIIIFFILNVGLSFVNGYVNMKDGTYGNVALFWINAVIGTVLCYFVALFLNRTCPVMKRILTEIGRNSIIYLGLNQLVILCLCLLYIPYIGEQGSITVVGLIGSIVITIVSIIILTFINKGITSTKLKRLFGK